jgi:integrase
MGKQQKQEPSTGPQRRRRNGKGSVTWRPERNKYQVSRSVNGKRRYVYVDTQQDADKVLRQWDREADQGVKFDRPDYTVRSFLEYWLSLKKPLLEVSSLASYTLHIKRINVQLGKVKLDKLTTDKVQAAFNALLEDLAIGTMKTLRAVFSTAMKDAVTWGLLSRNPVSGTKLPVKKEKSDPKALTLAQAIALMDTAREQDIQMWAIISMAVGTGLRVGELAGLRWTDIDTTSKKLNIEKSVVSVYVEGHTQYIEKSPKTITSIRELTLPDFAIEALEVHRRAQQDYLLQRGVRWVDMGLVFTGVDGYYIRRQTIRNRFRKILRLTASIPENLKDLHFHGLRHTAATVLLRQGIPVTTVQEMLGHASPEITWGVYAHALPGDKELAAGELNEMVQKLRRAVE